MKNFPTFSTLEESIFSERFEKLDKLFRNLTGDSSSKIFPQYNLKKTDEKNYVLEISVPSWNKEELEIEKEKNQIIITGKKKIEQKKESNKWIHKGIKKKNFKLYYSIPENVKITEAKLKLGILRINLYQKFPKIEKSKKIPILEKN